MSHRRSLRTFILIALFATILGACDSVELPEGTAAPGEPGTTVEIPETTEAPPGTEAPGTTAAPAVTEAPAEGEGEGISSEALFIGLGILLLFLVIGWLMGRSTHGDGPDRDDPEASFGRGSPREEGRDDPQTREDALSTELPQTAAGPGHAVSADSQHRFHRTIEAAPD